MTAVSGRPDAGARIFVLAHSLERTRARIGLPLLSLPGFAVRQGFAGLEVSDRQFSGRGPQELRRFAGACAVMAVAAVATTKPMPPRRRTPGRAANWTMRTATNAPRQP